MNLSDELKRLAELHARGTLTDAEFAAAKAGAIERANTPQSGPTDPRVMRELKRLRTQNELNAVDLEWDRVRESHMQRSNNGSRYEPAYWRAILTAVVAIGFGVFVISLAMPSQAGGFPAPPESAFPMALGFGLVAILAGLAYAGREAYLTSSLDSARQHYEQRRAAVVRSLQQSSAKPDPEGIHFTQ